MAQKSKPAPKTIADGSTVHGVVAEFPDVDSLLAACERVRDAGYTKADAFTPFPVHGIDKALGIKPTILPWIALAAGATGTSLALLMQISMNSDWIENFSYPYIISGKPLVSLPAFIPVAFELTILFASFGTFFGMWALNGLPKFSNPLFTSPRFDRVTDDTFFLYLDAKDERFDEAGAKALLGELGGEYIEPVREDESSSKIPRFLFVTIAVTIALSFIPALVVARMRVTKSDLPRFHIFPDMDFSPAKNAQQISTLFADGRVMRPDVPGTVNRGGMDWDVDFQTGIDMEKLTQIDAPRARQLVATMQSDVQVGADEEVADGVAEEPKAEEPKAEEPKAEEPEAEEPKGEEPKADEPASENSDKPEMTKESEKPSEDVKAEIETEEKLANEKPTNEKPTEEKPTEEKPAAEAPVKEMAAEEAAAEPEPAQAEVSGEKPEMPGSLAPASGPTVDTTPWLNNNPLEIDAAVLARGQQQFNIYCSVCHGMNGRGNGLVNQRAQRILATTWTPPSNIHDPTLYDDVYPDGKMFSTISNGIRKMPGYASQIEAKDRWAVVAYVRALQASQNATMDDVPKSQRSKIEKLQAKVKAELTKAADDAKAAEAAAKEEAGVKARAETAKAAAEKPAS